MEKQMQVKNYMETIVENQLDDIMKKNNCTCFCERCKADITALALNNLPTKYVATKKGDCYARLNSYEIQCYADVVTAITSAIKVVMANPRHDDE